jgi:glycosyltransferase involved in cell wall biosynthesis
VTRRDLRVVAPYGPTGASTRVRALDWVDHLGLSADLTSYLGTGTTGLGDLGRDPRGVLRAEVGLRRMRREVGDRPLLLVRNASPLSNGAVEASLLRAAGRGVYDFDDALMVQQPGLANALFSRARTWRRAVAAADVVLAGNDHLADAASSYQDHVTVVPSCVEPDAYRTRTEHGWDQHPVAVWLGSPSTEQYLRVISEALIAENRRSGLRVRVISGGEAPLGALSGMVDRVAWAPGVAEAHLAEATVGLMPLPDDPWTRGKCGYKLLQYAAAGLPVIGSPVGVNAAVLARLGGIGAATPDEWRDALRLVVDASASGRAAMGARALAGVRDHFSFARWAPVWRAATIGDLSGP